MHTNAAVWPTGPGTSETVERGTGTGVARIQSRHGMSIPRDCSGLRQICTLTWSMLLTQSQCAMEGAEATGLTHSPGLLDGHQGRGRGRNFIFQEGTYTHKTDITGTHSPMVMLWEVRAVAVSAPKGEMVKSVFPEESFLSLASTASVCGVTFSGASEEVWLFLGI